MKKIVSLFKRDYEGRPPLVYDEVVEGAEWVLAGEGIATRKWDGTCAMVSYGKLWKRYGARRQNATRGVRTGAGRRSGNRTLAGVARSRRRTR